MKHAPLTRFAGLLLGLASLAALGGCNDGDITVPESGQAPAPMPMPATVCPVLTDSVTSPDMSRTCTWRVEAGTAGQTVTDLACNGGTDCPASYVCSAPTGTATQGAWVPTSRVCPDPSTTSLPPEAGAANLYVSLNGDGNRSQVIQFTSTNRSNFTPVPVEEFSFDSTENQGIAIDITGTAVHVGDGLDAVSNQMGTVFDAPGVVSACGFAQRGTPTTAFEGNAYNNTVDGDTDRVIRGEAEDVPSGPNPPGVDNNPALQAPKGVTVIQEAGVYVVADFGASVLRVFSASASGNNAALTAVQPGAAPWDTAYDNRNDILYVALTNGRISVFNDFASEVQIGGVPGQDGLLELRTMGGAAVSANTNFHGIDYDPFSDTLVVTDVGDPMDATDGNVFFVTGVSNGGPNGGNLTGNVTVSATISNTAANQLGNPVDVEINGRDIVVAEKANDRVLVFPSVLDGFEPAALDGALRSLAVVKPESVAIETLGLNRPVSSDLDGQGTDIESVLVAVESGGNAVFQRLSADNLGVVANIEVRSGGATSNFFATSAFAANNGEGFVTYQEDFDIINGPFGGITYFNNIDDRATFGQFPDRTHSAFLGDANDNPLGEIVGIDFMPDLGLMLLADTSSGHVQILTPCAGINAIGEQQVDRTPSFNNPTDRDDDVSDIDYDPETGDLYASMINERFSVFRNFDQFVGSDPAPSVVVEPQIIDPTTLLVVSAATSLGAIEYVSGADVVIVSDSGPTGATAMEPNGQLLVMFDADELTETKRVNVTWAGDQTGLQDPTDLAFDGVNLYVVDAGAEMLYRFDNFLTRRPAGGETTVNIAPSQAVSVPGIRSVSLVPTHVGQAAVVAPE